jgi:hypothetical protein
MDYLTDKQKLDLERQDSYLTLIVGIKCVRQDGLGAVFCTSDKRHHKMAEELIAKGILIETTSKYFGPGSADRSFDLTDKGIEETDGIKVS